MAKENKGKERTLKNSFSYDGNSTEYGFRLKKKPNLWWLLLLLLPLLLLIPLKKDIVVITQTVDGKPEPNVDVAMNYTADYLLWQKHFLVKVPYDTVQTTDSEGKTVFKDVGYSVYSLIFKFNKPIVFTAGNECYEEISVERRFHTTRKVVMEMRPVVADVRFKVIDSELKFELPGALVECEYVGRNGNEKIVDTADAAGCVLIKDMLVCGEIIGVKASADGYADTLITGLNVSDLQADAEGFIIPLRPLKDQFTFFVKNKWTKEPIPDALAEVTLTYKGVNVSGGKTRTNVDGLGRGFFDDARLLAKVGITATKTPHYKPGKLEGDYTVRQFKALPDSLRVVWLEPEPYTVQFRNIDTVSLEPVAGVRNEITVEGIDGTVRKSVETSNRNGYFPVTAMAGDKITIVATLDPLYYPATKVVEQFEQEDTVYMHPALENLTFRTVELINGDDTGLLPDCDLEVVVDGVRVDPTNSGNGEFVVENLRLSSIISIVASKQYYEPNRTKVRNCKVSALVQAPQEDRDILLEIERSCGQRYMSRGFSDPTQTELYFMHSVGKPSGRVKFIFDTYNVGDSFELWNCKHDEVGKNPSNRLFTFNGISNDGINGGPEEHWFNYSNGPYFTVYAIRSGLNSDFEYLLCCADEDCEWGNDANGKPITIDIGRIFKPISHF